MSELIVIEKPTSAFSEAIKTVRTNLKFSSVSRKIKTIMVTSSVPSEGKSFVSANLAAAFAQFGEKVLLVDCDLRKGRQNKIFDISISDSPLGLSNLLIEENYLRYCQNYVQKTNIENLYILPAGTFPPNPSELLASDRCCNLLKLFREQYDVIILDCPPLTGLNDALVASSYADTSVIVARYKHTPMELLEKSKKSLENVGANIAGVILNQIPIKDNPYYYSSYYSEN